MEAGLQAGLADLKVGLYIERSEFRDQFQPANLQTVARRQVGHLHTLSVDERPVCALEVANLELTIGQRTETAVQPRYQGGVDDEVGAGGAAEGAHGPGEEPKRLPGIPVAYCPKRPHTARKGATFPASPSSTSLSDRSWSCAQDAT